MSRGTALVYDEEMTKYKLLWVDPACEVETPERLTVSHEALVRSGLAARCVPVPVREATDAEVLLAHSEEYLEAVKKTPLMSLEELMKFTLQYGDVYFHPNIYHCAKLAAGAALQLVDSVLKGTVRNGLALVRPPGHHSMYSAANGFCVFNNVAIAARYAKQKYGVERILIVDWDIHHGQGVQYCFEEDPSVLYFSWHRYEHQTFWPNLRESDFDSVGKEKGVGFNINVPWNKVGMENSDYLSIFCHLLLPVAYEFCPDLVLVCAGFDSGIGDPEGLMSATPDVFSQLTHLLMNLAGGKLCLVLEGGYNLTSLSQSVCQTVHTLLGDPAPRPTNLPGPCESALETLQCVRSAHRQYWSCLNHAADLPITTPSTKRMKVAEEQKLEENKGSVQTEEGTQEVPTKEVTWPEPPQRLAPSLRTAVVLPKDVICPHGCECINSEEDLSPAVISILREKFLRKSDDPDDFTALGKLSVLLWKMEKNEICNGLALVHDIFTALGAIQHNIGNSLTNRVLTVYVGDQAIPSHALKDERSLVVHIGSKQPDDHKYENFIPISLRKGCSDVVGLMQAVLSLLLPLGYQYDPSLVLLIRAPHSGLSESVWQQLIGLLQGLAHGHMLVLLQKNEKELVSVTTSPLLGNPASSLGQLEAPLQEDVETLDKVRQRLQDKWRLLRTTAQNISGGDED